MSLALNQYGTLMSLTKKLAILIAAAAFGICLAGLALHSFIRAWSTPSSNACPNNLRMIEGAKAQWALEHNKTNGATVTWVDILPYMGKGPTGQMPRCPMGGVYTIGKIGDEPKCSLGGTHSLQ